MNLFEQCSLKTKSMFHIFYQYSFIPKMLLIFHALAAPSPRQRCRIKTNPWLSAPETTVTVGNTNSMVNKMDIDTSSTSSGIKSSSDAGTDDKKRYRQLYCRSLKI